MKERLEDNQHILGHPWVDGCLVMFVICIMGGILILSIIGSQIRTDRERKANEQIRQLQKENDLLRSMQGS